MNLFDPFMLRELTLRNRIVVSPMCQYSAEGGAATDWHLIHWGQLLLSGAGMLTIEATAVTPEGRITPGCLGLFDDATEAALGDRLGRARRQAPSAPVAIQLAHAGRKGSRPCGNVNFA
jgi:2,4-dienoyl-CoA reductase-like NADH-dependent reductase (Old Yellow Enzyme family)